jgi:hypothetical protein
MPSLLLIFLLLFLFIDSTGIDLLHYWGSIALDPSSIFDSSSQKTARDTTAVALPSRRIVIPFGPGVLCSGLEI